MRPALCRLWEALVMTHKYSIYSEDICQYMQVQHIYGNL
jgi:hypothetical protein